MTLATNVFAYVSRRCCAPIRRTTGLITTLPKNNAVNFRTKFVLALRGERLIWLLRDAGLSIGHAIAAKLGGDAFEHPFIQVGQLGFHRVERGSVSLG